VFQPAISDSVAGSARRGDLAERTNTAKENQNQNLRTQRKRRGVRLGVAVDGDSALWPNWVFQPTISHWWRVRAKSGAEAEKSAA